MQQCSHGAAVPRVLIIEDDADVRSALVDTLDVEGYEVRAAGDGRAALVLLQAWRPCLIVLDRRLPLMDGPAFLEQLAVHEPAADIPVVLLTASLDRALTAEELRVTKIINKPYELDELLDVVARLAT